MNKPGAGAIVQSKLTKRSEVLGPGAGVVIDDPHIFTTTCFSKFEVIA